MARPESIAIGGYFPTPTDLILGLARCVALPVFEQSHNQIAIFDPCAADGEAIEALGRALFGGADGARRNHLSIWAGELEATRYEKLKERLTSYDPGAVVGGSHGHVLHGDALCAMFEQNQWGTAGVSVLLLNPPYNDQIKPRLEERFLRRFATALRPGGILLLLIPWKALPASADTLATGFEDIRCYRPEADRYGQVLLVAKKRVELFAPDESVKAQVLAWGADPQSIAPWSAIWHTAPIVAPIAHHGLHEWKIAPFDVKALSAAARPWYAPSKGSGELAPIGEVLADVGLARRYPVAMPLKPAYVAAAAACGVFDGARIAPNDPASGLPEVLVKGVFERYLQPVGDVANKDGEKVGEKVVEQPRLILTVLDLRAGTFHTLPAEDRRSGSRELASFTAADLLDAYSEGLLRIMRKNCPVLHDPARDGDDVDLPKDLARKLYPAQATVARAGIKLLSPLYRDARLKWWPEGGGAPINPLMLGEVGSGKSSIAAAIAVSILRSLPAAQRRALVLCPPHLTDEHGWIAQWRACFPAAKLAVHRELAEVDAFARERTELGVGVLSREAAKLGHGFTAVTPCCPKCGAPLPARRNLVEARLRCEAAIKRPHRAKGGACPRASLAVRLAELLHHVAPGSPIVSQIAGFRPRRHGARLGAAYARSSISQEQRWAKLAADARVRCVAFALAALYTIDASIAVLDAVTALLAGIGDDALTLVVIEEIAAKVQARSSVYERNQECAKLRRIAMIMEPNSCAQVDALDALFTVREQYGYSSFSANDAIAMVRALAEEGGAQKAIGEHRFDSSEDLLIYNGLPVGHVGHAIKALELIADAGAWTTERVCGEHLYQAAPSPKRYPLARYIARRHPRLYGILIRDESHEYSDSDAAQTIAAGQLTQLGMPVLSLTGSACGGYAESLFASQWATDVFFRARYPAVMAKPERPGDRPYWSTGPSRAEFVRTYGYKKGVIEDRDKEGKVVAFGSQSDRVIRTAKMTGNAPGVLPKFLLDFLLRGAITIHKEELDLSLPKHTEELIKVPLNGELGERFEKLASALRREIKRARYIPDKAGKLWGALAELASFPDVAIEGIGGEGHYAIRYPLHVEEGEIGTIAGKVRGRTRKAFKAEEGLGELVIQVPLFPASTILPKERWMLAEIEKGLKACRRPLVFARHIALVPRLATLIRKELSVKVAELPSSGAGAGTAQRQVWIHENVVNPSLPVMVVNPTKVQTGINALVHFCDAIWMENPGCNAIVWRQANGRIDRIGKTLPTRAIMPVYAGMQEKAQILLHHKVGVSLATDGLDPRSALAMAGIGANGAFDAMSVAQQLYKAMGWDA